MVGRCSRRAKEGSRHCELLDTSRYWLELDMECLPLLHPSILTIDGRGGMYCRSREGSKIDMKYMFFSRSNQYRYASHDWCIIGGGIKIVHVNRRRPVIRRKEGRKCLFNDVLKHLIYAWSLRYGNGSFRWQERISAAATWWSTLAHGIFYIDYYTNRIVHTTAFWVLAGTRHSLMGPPQGVDPSTHRTTSGHI